MIIATILILQTLSTAGLMWLLLLARRSRSSTCGSVSPADEFGDTHTCVLAHGHDGSHADTHQSLAESRHGFFWRDVPFLVERPTPEHINLRSMEEDDAPNPVITYDPLTCETTLTFSNIEGESASFKGSWGGIEVTLKNAMEELEQFSKVRIEKEVMDVAV